MSDDPFARDFIDLSRARQLLGTAAGADARAIRRAYADRLRALDVDLDPQGFADLRDARDVALADARERAAATAPVNPDPFRGPPPDAPEPPDGAAYADPIATEVLSRGPSPDQPERPDVAADGPDPAWTPAQGRGDGGEDADRHGGSGPAEPPPDPAEIEHHARALATLLAPEDGLRVPLTRAEQAAAHAHLDVLLADPRLDHVEYRPAAEAWIAELIVAAGTRADPVVPRVIAAFGWAAQHGRIDQPPAQAAVVERAALLADAAAGPQFVPVAEETREVYGGEASGDLSDRASARWWGASRTLAGDGADVSRADPDPAGDAALADHARDLAALLAPDREAAETLAPDEAGAAHAHLDALLADPRLDRLDFREGAGAWYAELAATAGARADPVLPRLVAFFGWERDRDRFDQPPAQAWALERLDLLAAWAAEDTALAAYRHQLDQPYHYYHRAWRDLTERRTLIGWLLPRSLPRTRADLIEMLRVEQPRLHAEVVAAQPRWIWWVRTAAGVAVAVLLLQLLVVIEGLGRDSPPAGGAAPATVAAPPVIAAVTDDLTVPERDIEPVLVGFGGGALNVPAVRAANPAWYRQLDLRWAEARIAGTPRSTYMTDLFQEIATRYRAAFRRAPYDQVARGRRLERDRLVYARDRFGTLACGDLVAGEPVPEMIDRRFRDARQALAGEVLLTMRGIPAERTAKRFSIPIALYRAAARRAGLSPDDFGRAIDREGTSEAGCNAWIALYDEALAAPRAQGLKLLREM